MFQQAAAGNPDPLMRFAREIDGDQTSARSAAMKVIKELYTVPQGGAGAGGGGPGAGGPGDIIQQVRSMQQGGIPGQAEQLPQVGGGLRTMLPAGNVPALAEGMPGASGP